MKRIKPKDGNKTFCMAPFSHTYISPQSERRLCCASREEPSWQKQYIDSGSASSLSYQPLTLNKHWNSEHLKSVRKRMLAGEILSECQICNENILNLHTYRQYFTETLFPHYIDAAFENTNDDGETTLLPISFDYRINNLCNFKCRMCGEQLSSSWETEKRIMNAWDPEKDPWMIPDNKKKIQTFQKEVVEKELWDAVYNETLEEIYWVGGEPLMWEIHWHIMEYLIKSNQAKNITIRYNTNLSRTNYKGQELYNILPYFKNVNVCASIDATGEIGEFIRTGLNWHQWLQNFKDGLFLIEKFGHDAIVLDVTLTTPGMFDMKNMFDLALALDVKTYLKITFAFDPTVLMSPMALSRDALNEVLDELITYCESKTTWKTQVYIDTFRDMKNRQTFAEQWPDKYQEGFQNGKKRLEQISSYRNDSIKMENILTKKALEWWNE